MASKKKAAKEEAVAEEPVEEEQEQVLPDEPKSRIERRLGLFDNDNI